MILIRVSNKKNEDVALELRRREKKIYSSLHKKLCIYANQDRKMYDGTSFVPNFKSIWLF
jgi:hypothetical protein